MAEIQKIPRRIPNRLKPCVSEYQSSGEQDWCVSSGREPLGRHDASVLLISSTFDSPGYW